MGSKVLHWNIKLKNYVLLCVSLVMSSPDLLMTLLRSAKINHVGTETLAQAYSYTQVLSMHSISTAQCKLVCFFGGHCADPVKSQM